MKIINLGVFAHVDAGKTSVTEQMLGLSGVVRNTGSVDKGTASSDYLEMERRRGISVKAAATNFEWKQTQINLIDTPGHTEFIAEVERSLLAVDSAVLVVSAVEGIESGTETIWHLLREFQIPTVFFINKIDRVGADAEGVINAIRDKFGISLFAVNDDLTEFAAEYNDEILEKYLAGFPVKSEQIDVVLSQAVAENQAFPVICGSAVDGVGVDTLLDGIVRFLPNAPIDDESEPSGIIFRIDHDARLGRVAHIRLWSGVLHPRDTVQPSGSTTPAKITQIKKYRSQRSDDLSELRAGDIGALCGISDARVGDTIGNAKMRNIRFSTPLLYTNVVPKNPDELPKLSEAMAILSAEDPSLALDRQRETGELTVSVAGTIQIEYLSSALNERFHLDAEFLPPKVIYRETPSKPGVGFDDYTWPKPCWAVLEFAIEPGEPGSGLRYECKVSSGDLLPRYKAHVESAVPRALRQGPRGWEVTDLKVTMTHGGWHHVHTHPLDFFVCTPMAIANGLQNTGTDLLEPILSFRLTAAEDLAGRLIGELLAMRAETEDSRIENGSFIAEGRIPLATSMNFPERLASISGGRGRFSTVFSHYQRVDEALGVNRPRRGVDPLDRPKFILWARGALGNFSDV